MPIVARCGNTLFFISIPLFFSIQPVYSIDLIGSENIVYSETLETTEASNLLLQLNSLGASYCSEFPYVAQRGDRTFVNFSQIKRDAQGNCPHGNGSVSVVAVREHRDSQWTYFTPFVSAEAGKKFLDHVKSLNAITAVNPLVLRTHVIHPDAGKDNPLKMDPLGPISHSVPNMVTWSEVQRHPTQTGYVRTGYSLSTWETWLLKSPSLPSEWTAFPDGCGPVAKRLGMAFSESAVAYIGDHHWLALIREDSAAPNAIRYLYQSSSVDDGCTWSDPKWVGDGDQPHLVRIDIKEGESRLVMTVGDRVVRGWTSELGIQCRVSSNLIGVTHPGEIRWGPPRMIFKTTRSSELGQPGTIHRGGTELETFFYADRKVTTSDGLDARPDILSVVYRLTEDDYPENSKNPADVDVPSMPFLDNFDGNPKTGVSPRQWNAFSGADTWVKIDDTVFAGSSGKSVHLNDSSSTNGSLIQMVLEPAPTVNLTSAVG